MDRPTDNRQRATWLKTLLQWHWISSALCLLGMLLFSITGITLNHASEIESKPRITTQEAVLPATLKADWAAPGSDSTAADARGPLPPALQAWLADTWGVRAGEAQAEWSAEEIYLSLPRPGGDAWVRIDRESGAVEFEQTDRGWVSYFNDLHKGRHTGVAWSWFIDIFAAACLVFSITGLLILKLHAVNRPITWPLVGLGAVIPLLLALLFIH
jgi:hypothetical protein